jgi:tetratricopeptide (TPR) repeat protein
MQEGALAGAQNLAKFMEEIVSPHWKYLRIIAGFVAGGALAMGETPITLSGELSETTSYANSRLMVELRSLDGRGGPTPRSYVNPDGTFEFRELSSGTYELIVSTDRGAAVRNEIVHVSEQNNRVSLRLGPIGGEVTHNGVVSIQRLQHKPPKAARKEFERAYKAQREKKSEEEILHLRKAIELDPEYFEAYNNLGVRYLELGDYANARKNLERVIAIDERSAEGHTNLAALSLSEGFPSEAETHARRSIALGGDPSKTSYLLGLALAYQGRLRDAITPLENAAGSMPRAKLVLADVYAKTGDRVSAGHQLKSYLESGQPERRAEVERWMSTLARR